LRELDTGGARQVEMDGSGIGALDSAGAWLLLRTKRTLEESGRKIVSFKIPQAYDPLFDTLERGHTAPPVEIPKRHTMTALLERVGRGFMGALGQGYAMLGFLGRVTVETVQAILRPGRELPWPAFVHQIEETGINAIPIVGLLSFLIGVVLAYQGADQLRRFGAEIFTVNLLGVSTLREIGGLMTAIIVAGRSGSAFTAQIGTMKVNQEVDAMQTIGLNTVEILVLPRVLGLMITLPLLTFYADIMGILGGGMMCYFDLGFTAPVFIKQLHSAVELNTFLVGMIKAPVFAFLIALVGCFEGLRVESNAASVGQRTTASVVEAIFLVIAFDAGFSILFSVLGI
jgi:phospholipid/cholesterol/gamma-HCH transport system permease protein